MIDYLRAVKCPELEDVLKKFDIVEKRAKISLNNYLGKAILTSLQTKTGSGWKYYGELNADGKEHGRGIIIFNNGYLDIGYYEDGYRSTGNYIIIYSDGVFGVAESYMRDGKRWYRCTQYKTDGTERPYDSGT